ncbi:MAG: alpha/beta hydrolase [Magnetococcales bacterium]|nr:alpha/beta hydrolase [Magnetococcales bacterium]
MNIGSLLGPKKVPWAKLATLLLVLGYASICLYLYETQEQKIFRPRSEMLGTPTQWGMTYADVHLQVAGERLHGWWLPARTDTPTVLFLHGNARNISQLQDFAGLFSRLEWPVLMIDYRGYGASDGKPSENGLYADGEAAWHYLTIDQKIPATRIILYGHSLGSGVATWLASRHAAGGVVLEGAFTSIPDRAAEIYPYLPVRWLSHITFDNRARMRDIHAPLLMIHSREDQVIPFHHGERLFAAANIPKRLVDISGHHGHAFVRWPGAHETMRAFGELVMRGGRDSS